MDFLAAIVLAIVQGATEFLPVSSSGHLVLIPAWLGWDQAPLSYDIVLHFGTLVAVLVYYRHELTAIVRSIFTGRDENDKNGVLGATSGRYLALLIIIATVPAALVGIFFEDIVDEHLLKPLPAAIGLLVTGLFLYAADRVGARANGHEPQKMTKSDALMVGIAQAVAIMPGVSRSGSTIMAGLGRGLSQNWAARFAFLMSIPPIAGAFVLAAKDIAGLDNVTSLLPQYVVGFVIAGAVGFASIHLVTKAVEQGRLFARFGIYCLSLGLLSIVAYLMGWI